MTYFFQHSLTDWFVEAVRDRLRKREAEPAAE